MSIELTGPAAYERQYRISLLLALGLLDSDPALSVVVEAAGGEDAQLTLPGGRILEVQVKTETTDIDWTTFASILAHFENRRADRCTLTRLSGDSSRSLLLAGSGRATDAIRGFLKPRGKYDLPPSQKWPSHSLSAFTNALRALYANARSKLDKDRHVCCQRLAIAIEASDQNLISALNRIVVWELTDDTAIKADIAAFLFRHSGVPSVQASQVTSALTDEIRNARDRRGDALPGIKKVLTNFRASRLRHGSMHLDRGDEATWENLLSQTHHLALGGHSKCGKTHLAHELLVRLQARGWRCAVFNDVDEAARFLQADDPQERVCLIDDPLGDLAQPRALARLQNVPDWCRPDRMAIVTSSSGLLRRIKQQFKFGHSGPAGLIWHDCTVTNREYLKALWAGFCQEGKVSMDVVDAITGLLGKMPKSDLLQPGQLRHLARRPAVETAGHPVDELVAIARFTDESIILELSRDTATALAAVAVALACDGLRGARDQDLAFVASDSDQRPAHFEHRGIVSFKMGQKGFPQFPSYPSTDITIAFRPLLEEWVARGYLRRESDRWYFSHPDYREAFTQLALTQLRSQSETRILAERALAALSPYVCLAAERILARLWRENDSELITWSWGQLLRAFGESIFPAIREQVMATLLSSRQRISGDDLDHLLRLATLEFPGDANLIWENDTPWICRGTDAGYGDRLWLRHRLPQKREFPALCRRLLEPGHPPELTERALDQIVCYLVSHDSVSLELPVLLRAGRSEHSFIRASVAELLCGGRLPFGEEAKRSLDDPDARVTAHAIKILIESWHQHHAAGHAATISGAINSALQYLPVAVLVSRALFDFGDLYSERVHIRWDTLSPTETKDLWADWASWMGTALAAIAPYPFYFKDGDLFTTLKAAPGHLTAAAFQKLVEAWIDFIEKRSLVSGLSDYTYGVSDILFDPSSPLNAVQRETLLGRVLQLRATDPVIDNLGTMVELWGRITKTEQKLVTDLLTSNRADLHWLRAAVLVRDCPRVLCPLAGNCKDFYKQAADEVIATLPPELLRSALAIIVRNTPGSANLYVRYHRRFWEAIAVKIRSDWNHPDQPSMIFRLLMRFDDDVRREPLVAACDALCRDASASGRKLLFQLLCRAGQSAPHVHLHEFGTSLYNVCSEAERKTFMEEFAPDINLIEDQPRTVVQLWGKEWSNFLLQFLPADNRVLNILRVFKEFDADGLKKIGPLVEIVYRKDKPLMRFTHEWMLRALEKAGLKDSAAYKLVDDARSDTFEYERQKGYGTRPKNFRDGWIW